MELYRSSFLLHLIWWLFFLHPGRGLFWIEDKQSICGLGDFLHSSLGNRFHIENWGLSDNMPTECWTERLLAFIFHLALEILATRLLPSKQEVITRLFCGHSEQGKMRDLKVLSVPVTDLLSLSSKHTLLSPFLPCQSWRFYTMFLLCQLNLFQAVPVKRHYRQIFRLEDKEGTWFFLFLFYPCSKLLCRQVPAVFPMAMSGLDSGEWPLAVLNCSNGQYVSAATFFSEICILAFWDPFSKLLIFFSCLFFPQPQC